MGGSTKCCSIENGALEPEVSLRRVGDMGTTDHRELMSAGFTIHKASSTILNANFLGGGWRDKEMSTGSMDQMRRRKTGGGTGYRLGREKG